MGRARFIEDLVGEPKMADLSLAMERVQSKEFPPVRGASPEAWSDPPAMERAVFKCGPQDTECESLLHEVSMDEVRFQLSAVPSMSRASRRPERSPGFGASPSC